MSLQTCQQHLKLKDTICARNQCIVLLCEECFNIHSETFQHKVGVRLNTVTKQFFMRWTEFLYHKLCQYLQVASSLGYNKIFELKLDQRHPYGLIDMLNLIEIQKVTIQTLKQHQNITQANLKFVKKIKHIAQLIHPQFLKDLYNLVVADARANLFNIPTTIHQKLNRMFPEKEIYKYVRFQINSREISILEKQRVSLLKGNQKSMIYQVSGYYKQAVYESHHVVNKNISVKNVEDEVPEKIQIKVHSNSQLFNQTTVNNSSVQLPLPVTNSPKQNSPRLTSIHSISDQQLHNQKLQLTISLFKSNEQMYKQKISRLQKENRSLKKYMQESKQTKLTKSEQLQEKNHKLLEQVQALLRFQQQLTNENQQFLNKINELQGINNTLKLNISTLQTELRTITENIQFKQRSILQLNLLISNQQQQIAYRQNEVQILQGQIKKLLNRNQFLERSIHQLNNLISNEEEEISYRENQSETLTGDVKKLLMKVDILQKENKYLQIEKENIQKENQNIQREIQNTKKDEQLINNQAQIHRLVNEMTKWTERNKQLQRLLLESQSKHNKPQIQKQTIFIDPNQELVQQTVLLQADVQNLKHDVNILRGVIEETFIKKSASELAYILSKIKGLRTMNVSKLI